MKVIHRLSAFLVTAGIILTIGAAGASDTGTDIQVLYPYIIVGITSLVLGALGMYTIEEV